MDACAVAHKHVIVFVDPCAGKADGADFCSRDHHAAVSLGNRPEQMIGIRVPYLRPQLQIRNMNALMLLNRLDERDDSSEIGWLKRVYADHPHLPPITAMP